MINILNRLGVCSSIDTLLRRIQYITSVREDTGAEHKCNARALTFISADNIDFLHSYAQVFCGNQQSSWHGTTVQAAQPMPSMHVQREEEHPKSSPQYSLGLKRAALKTTTPVPKVRRRARCRNGCTAQSNDTLSANIQLDSVTNQACDHNPLFGRTLRDFEVNPEEKQALEHLRKQLAVYMLIKTEHTSQSNTQNLLNIREYMQITNPQTIEPSNVVYLSVLDAKADSKDTIMQVLQDANKQYIKGLKKQHVIMEGDAKVYELIQSLKHEYPEEFHWVLPYPGDWHLLRNFQRVLMKAYCDAGLREMAQESTELLPVQAHPPFHSRSLGSTLQGDNREIHQHYRFTQCSKRLHQGTPEKEGNRSKN